MFVNGVNNYFIILRIFPNILSDVNLYLFYHFFESKIDWVSQKL